MIEFLSFVLFMLLFIFLLMSNIKSRVDNFTLAKINLQLAIEKIELAKMLEHSLAKNIETPLTETEGFVNFISQSRDWAFDYIEDVQNAIGVFIEDIEPEILYFDEYGVVGDAYPHYHSMKKISVAYKQLKKLIPEDYGKLD